MASAKDVAVAIATCPIVDVVLARGADPAHPCHTVVRQNNPTAQAPRALPEPWYGGLDEARLLFVSSNPGGGKPKAQADSADPDDIFNRAQTGLVGNTDWYARDVEALASQLYGRAVAPGVDYSITEVVHCGSAGERAGNVRAAVHICAPRYMSRILEVSPADVVVLVGGIARDWFSDHLPGTGLMPGKDWAGPSQVGGRKRIFLVVDHPRAHGGAKPLTADQVALARPRLT